MVLKLSGNFKMTDMDSEELERLSGIEFPTPEQTKRLLDLLSLESRIEAENRRIDNERSR
jgi:hypothetical protein